MSTFAHNRRTQSVSVMSDGRARVASLGPIDKEREHFLAHHAV